MKNPEKNVPFSEKLTKNKNYIINIQKKNPTRDETKTRCRYCKSRRHPSKLVSCGRARHLFSFFSCRDFYM